MSWNSATTKLSREVSRSSSSITRRLTITYTLITFALLAVTISALYYALLKSLEEEDTLFLTEKVEYRCYLVTVRFKPSFDYIRGIVKSSI